jgi:transcriptional regulator
MRQVAGIVAFEIEIDRIEAVKKMSQNRNERDYSNIVSELEKTDNTASKEVAAIMKKCPF